MSGVLVRGRKLPHWDIPGAAYFVTTCLEGSIPARGLLDIARYRERLEARTRPSDVSPEIWTTRHRKMSFARTDEWLDHRPAVRHLADPKLAKVVVDALRFFAGQRYDLLAFVVMPSHFHWVFQPRVDWIETLESSERSPRQRILHTINRHTALECDVAQHRNIRAATGCSERPANSGNTNPTTIGFGTKTNWRGSSSTSNAIR